MMNKVHGSLFTVHSVLTIITALIFNCSFYAICFAQQISSTELINGSKIYDGKIVTYEGEVIGDIMKRGDFAWINVNDGKNAIGIWVDAFLTKDIYYTGSFKSVGDVVEINGVFHRACVEHGGDLDIHAKTLRKTAPGRLIQEKINPGKWELVLILLGMLGLIWILSLLKRK